MIGDEDKKTHSQAEVDTIKSVTRVETILCVMKDDFRDHKQEDDKHFKQLFNVVESIPSKMFECREDLKLELQKDASSRYATRTELVKLNGTVATKLEKMKGEIKTEIETINGSVKTEVATVRGSIKSTQVIVAMLQTILLVVLAAWIRG